MTNKQQKGFTIVELMVAVSIAIVLTGFLLSIFNNNKKAYNNNNRMIELNSNIRFAMSIIRDDLVNAGFYGGLTSKDTIAIRSNIVNDYCEDSTHSIRLSTASSYPIWSTATGDISGFLQSDCLNGIDATTDFISIRGVRGNATADDSLEESSVYIRAGKTTGEFIAKGLGSSIPSSTNMNWKYYSHIYYICQNRLLRQALVYDSDTDNSVWETHVLIGPALDGTCEDDDDDDSHSDAGIEDMQLSYGIDDDQDGVVNYYTDATNITTNAAWNNVVEVKIFILARSAQDMSYTDSKTYTVGSEAMAAANDNHRRKVFSSTVFLRNNWYSILNDPGSL